MGRREKEEVGRVVEWGGVEAADDWETVEDRLFPPPPPPFLAPLFTAIGTSTSCKR